MDRKYKHRGYRDDDSKQKPRERVDKPQEPRPKHDMLGPRTPRMVGTVIRARCANCGAVLTPGFDQNGACPRCNFTLHCCKQCVNFDSGKQFECTQPIAEAISKKDAKNSCLFFEFRSTVEKDTSPVSYSQKPVQAPPAAASRPNDARKAFEDLFKK